MRGQNGKVGGFFRAVSVVCAMEFLFLCGAARAQVTQQQMQQRTLKLAPLKNITAYNGKISGVVYWDTTKVVRNTEATLFDVMGNTSYTFPVPPGCEGTQIYVMAFDQQGEVNWQTETSTFSYSTNGSLAICAYTIGPVPEGQTLFVAPYVPSEDYSLKTGTTTYGDMAAVPVSGDNANWWYTWGSVGGAGALVTVVSISCRDLVSFASSNNLTSGPRSCGGDATNVNFVVDSFSGYAKRVSTGNGGSAQQLPAAQARAVAQITRPRRALSGGELTAQSASSKPTGISGQRSLVPPANTRPANSASPQIPISQTTSQPLLANGGKSGTLLSQSSGVTNGTMGDGSHAAVSSSGAAVTTNGASPLNGGSQPQPAQVPSKGHEKSAYEAVTVDRGETHDPAFTNWAASDQGPNGRASQAGVAGAPSPVLTPRSVSAACAKDPSLRILGVTGSAEPIAFVHGRTYTIWGCSFGPENPNNAVYLSDGGLPGSAFTWHFQKISWAANSVVVKVSTAPSTTRSNLMLFVLGQNGNTKLDGVTLKAF